MKAREQWLRLRILLADDDLSARRFVQKSLELLGHETMAVENAKALAEAFPKFCPDLLITEITLEGINGLAVASELQCDRPIPIIVVTSHSEHACIQQALDTQVFAYLIKPINAPGLQAEIEITMNRFMEFQELQAETQELRQALQDRKYIERAKGILMKQKQIPESAAFRMLQDTARKKRMKLIDIANAVLTADALGDE